MLLQVQGQKKLLNGMKMYAATNIRLSTEADKEGVFLIGVSKKDYPTWPRRRRARGGPSNKLITPSKFITM